jgi:hypothetical protein
VAFDLQPGCIVHGCTGAAAGGWRGLALLVAGEGLALLLVAEKGWLKGLLLVAGRTGLAGKVLGWRGAGAWWLEADWGYWKGLVAEQ